MGKIMHIFVFLPLLVGRCSQNTSLWGAAINSLPEMQNNPPHQTGKTTWTGTCDMYFICHHNPAEVEVNITCCWSYYISYGSLWMFLMCLFISFTNCFCYIWLVDDPWTLAVGHFFHAHDLIPVCHDWGHIIQKIE